MDKNPKATARLKIAHFEIEVIFGEGNFGAHADDIEISDIPIVDLMQVLLMLEHLIKAMTSKPTTVEKDST